MKKFDLNGNWKMTGNGYECFGKIPGSVYSFLLDNGLMDDPYYRDNEFKALSLMEEDYTFSRTFNYSPDGNPVLLYCEGLDTICDLYINGKQVGHSENMHRAYEFSVTDFLLDGENEISVICRSPLKYIQEFDKKYTVHGAWDSVSGTPFIRKAHCMFGWDWGPMLPDAGIWRDIYLLKVNSARITETEAVQRHKDGKVFITPKIKFDGTAETEIILTSPDGESTVIAANEEYEIKNPRLWWPNGMGEHPLYTLEMHLIENGETVDSVKKRIGLRTLVIEREKDEYGESFVQVCNGVPLFAMGADYIPEDNILSRITPERSRKLLLQCIDSNFNTIRIWGGGYYPDDSFFDACDELGLILFQDMMFACVCVWDNEDFLNNVMEEFSYNIKRMRDHACIGVISGNNELERCFVNVEENLKNTMIDVFDVKLRKMMRELAPYISYIPSSPTSMGRFNDPDNEDYGDSHYWEVWHGERPFYEYRDHYFRYLSEFGFQSFPCEKTVNGFTLPDDRNIFSRVMEQHQRNRAANGKIIKYLSDTYLYPADFGTLLYATQLLQATAIRYGVEHLRRNRGRCMGTLYWQLNDIWPVASWASIDYCGRFKALQYYAKRFYAPILLSCEETGEKTTRPFVTLDPYKYDYRTAAKLCVTNDTAADRKLKICSQLRNNKGEILENFETTVCAKAYSVTALDEKDYNKTDVSKNYLSYQLFDGDKLISEGTTLFTAPKHFEFTDPQLSAKVSGDEITVSAKGYAMNVEIYSPDGDLILSDNFFDINGGTKTVKILEGKANEIKLRSVYDIR